MKQRKWWIIFLAVLAVGFIGFMLRPSHITKEFVRDNLRKGMTVAQIEEICSLRPGTLRLDDGTYGPISAVLVDSGDFVSLVTPRDHITLKFDSYKKLQGAWYELVLLADELVEEDIPLREPRE